MDRSDRERQFTALCEEGRWKEASAILEPVVADEPGDYFAATQLSACCLILGETARAIELAHQAYAQDREDPLVLWNYAAALVYAGRHRDARCLLNRILSYTPWDIGVWFTGSGVPWGEAMWLDALVLLAKCQWEFGETNKAAQTLHEHLRLRRRGVRPSFALQQVKQAIRTIEGGENPWREMLDGAVLIK